MTNFPLIGHNDLVSGNVIVNLISKLTILRRYCFYLGFCSFFLCSLLLFIDMLLSRVTEVMMLNDRFSELSLNGLKISKAVVDGLCRLAKALCLSGLMLAGTSIGTVRLFFFIVVMLICLLCLL